MPRTAAFDQHRARYEAWFARHAAVYQSELLAVRALLPREGLGLEVGVGTGRFAASLGVGVGLDPSQPMLEMAKARGIAAVRGIAEALPFRDSTFDSLLIVTTICFVDSAAAMVAEASRVLKPKGRIVIGFIDRDSPVGKHYLARRADSLFYRDASLYAAHEVESLLSAVRFGSPEWRQTLSQPVEKTSGIEAGRPGRGRGAFVVVSAAKGATP